MMTVSLQQLLEIEPFLHQISVQDGLSAKVKYHVVKLVRAVTQEAADFRERRMELFRTLGDGQEVPAERVPEFKRQIEELLATKVSVPIGPLRSVDLPNAKASELIGLGPFCELVEPE